jgi:hypothetical protein
VAILIALVGLPAIGPEALLVLAMASVVLVLDPREAVMPFLANGLQMAAPRQNRPVPRVAPLIAVMVLAGLLVAGVVTLTTQYNRGINQHDNWANKVMPRAAFNQVAQKISELESEGLTTVSLTASTAERLAMIDVNADVVPWIALGMIFVLACTFARLRIAGWPLHPVAFLVWGTYPCAKFWFSFLLGWLIKVVIVKLAGERYFRRALPLMVGLIAGELVAGLAWILVGVIYYLTTGQTPASYRIYPG